ncbi:putative amino acid permease [Lyophyllum shimeji]|uniref:Amino acid permease n=1 Tax=Lyophyllum shimeji TaxID=47721 RepID=A0A9P3PN77_LYOSH|nr:putative amino acid permease [Lyophyllum shimeji]
MAKSFPEQAGQPSETDRLLARAGSNGPTTRINENDTRTPSKGFPPVRYGDRRDGHNVPQTGEPSVDVSGTKQQLGLFSAVFLIFNCIIGTGIYATPSIILRFAGSVGIALLMWVVGALLASTGTAVFIELGTGLPRSGGEKTYLEFIYRRPRYLMTCMFAAYTFFAKSSQAANSVVFGEYVLHSLSITPSRFNTRGVAFLCLTFCFLVHGITPTLGIRLQNTLGLIKLLILCAIAASGLFCLAGVPGFSVRGTLYETPNNFEWRKFWEGSSRTSPNAFVTGLFNVLWSFNGYAHANDVLSEVKDPVRTIRWAGPLAIESIIAALFFRNLFGPATEKAVSVIIAFSLLGNLLAGFFAQARVIQELGREGVLPRSSFFASNKPFDGPMAGLFTQWFIACTFMLTPPPGDAYLFMIGLSVYSISIINVLVSFGLLLLYTQLYRNWDWHPPFRAPRFIVVIFFLLNLALVVVPFSSPTPGSRVYAHLPYWAHLFGAYLILLSGIVYCALTDVAMIIHESASTALQIQIHDILHVLGVSVLLYDYLITVGDEVDYMWLFPKGRSTWWYFVNRYFSILSNIAVTVLNFTSLANTRFKRAFHQPALICLLFSLRVSALYGRSLWVVGFMIGTAAGLGAVALVQLFGQKSAPSQLAPGCHIGISHRTATRFSIAWGTVFVYDVLLFGLSIVKTLQTRRNHGMIPIVELVFRDGAIYFAIITVVNGANMITYWTSGPFMRGGLSTFAGCVSSTLMSRIMLNMHASTHLGMHSIVRPGSCAGQDQDPASPGSPHRPCRDAYDGVELDTLWTTDLEPSRPSVHGASSPEFQIPELPISKAPPWRGAS